MASLLYLMNVDWNWIKQRPHFIAEKLRNDFDITIVNQKRYSSKNLQNRELSEDIFTMKVIPRIDRYSHLRKINDILRKYIITRLIKRTGAEYIYITDPSQIEWITKEYKGKIIYDCMDDHIGLARNDMIKKRLKNAEEVLSKRADYIIYSSKYLMNMYHRRYTLQRAIKEEIVRNAFNGEIIEPSTKERSGNYVICYFGTISDWFDFELINKSLEMFNNIEYLLIGPLHRNTSIPENARIKYIGTVEHEDLQKKTENADCFVMPFKLDESIKAVDPVKLYEYINFGKNIVCIRYEEIERFSKFIFFYDNSTEYMEIISSLLKDNKTKYSSTLRETILSHSTWEDRRQQILRLLYE